MTHRADNKLILRIIEPAMARRKVANKKKGAPKKGKWLLHMAEKCERGVW